MTDAEARAYTTIANIDREDLGAMDQGRLVGLLLEACGGDHKAVALQTGHTEYWVRTHAALRNLTAEWQKGMAAADGKYSGWNAGHWILVARLPAEAQHRLFNDLERSYGRPPRDVEELEDVIAQRQRLLSKAPWKLDDALLLKRAGPCTTCPKHTAACSSLFYQEMNAAAVKKDDRCLDGSCWDRKATALRTRKVEAALVRHPEAVKITSGYGARKGALSHWNDYDEGEKGDKGAVEAVVVDGPGAGGLRYIKLKPAGAKRAAAAAGSGETPAEAIRRLRAELKTKREQEYGNQVRDLLRRHADRLKMPKPEILVRLAAGVGVAAAPGVWGEKARLLAMKIQTAPMAKVHEELWLGICAAANEIWEQELVLKVGGFDEKNCRAAIAAAIPEPAEIAKLEAQVKAEKSKETKVPTCRFCGCTEDHACPGGCGWVTKAKDVCSNPKCVARLEEEKAKARKAKSGK